MTTARRTPVVTVREDANLTPSKVTYRLDYRRWVPDLDGGEGHAAECKPREFSQYSGLLRYRDSVDRLYDWRVTVIRETVIDWGDPK